MLLDIMLTSSFWVLGLGGVILLLLEVFLDKGWPRALFTAFTACVSIGISLVNAELFTPRETAFGGLVYADTFTLFFSVFLSIGLLLCVILGLNRSEGEGIEAPGEYYALLLMATSGAVLFASAAELITLFLGLEIMSMALYCLCGAALARRESSESALKYFLLGSFSSAFLLYGIALLYGISGSTSIPEIAAVIAQNHSSVVYLSLGLLLIGLVFKLGAVPLHFWAPDVYQGAPTPVAAYMACVVKAAAIAATMRVLWILFPTIYSVWAGAVWLVSVLTIVAGNLIALRQNNVKRMLAYSSIAHAGYIMAAFLAQGADYGGGPAILFYIVSYTAMTLGAFGVVLLVGSTSSGKVGAEDILAFNGLGFSRPYLGALMALFLLSLAGLPPGMAGLVGKVYVFSAVVKAGYVGLAVIGMIGSAISCYYYLRVIVAMYFVDPSPHGGKKLPGSDFALASVLCVCAILVVFVGVNPSALYSAASEIIKASF